jgi:hypothetical protein
MTRTKKKPGEPDNRSRKTRVVEDKELPPYWYQRYRNTYLRYRKFYGITGNAKGLSPMHEILIEKVAYLSVKMLYYESPDFFKETGLNIENPLYMGKYDNQIKAMVKLIEQLQKYTEPKPVARSVKKVLTVNTTAQEIKELKDADLNRAITEIISGKEIVTEQAPDGEAVKEGPESG